MKILTKKTVVDKGPAMAVKQVLTDLKNAITKLTASKSTST